MLDTIIVGQGIAGSSLAYELMKRGKKVMLIDNGHRHSASRISAGLMQHVFGKFLTMNALIEDCFDEAIAFYKQLEKDFSCSFIKELDLYKQLTPLQEQIWEKKKKKAPYNKHLSQSLITRKQCSLSVHPAISVSGNAVVDTERLLDAFKQYFLSHNSYELEQFEYAALKGCSDAVTYKQFQAKHIIFCTGSALSKHPLLTQLPFENVKGDTFTLNSNALSRTTALQAEFSLVPHSTQFRLGANYDHDLSHDRPTEKAYTALQAYLKGLQLSDYELLCQHSATRCILKDNLPIVGCHPKNKSIGFFSGFSSRGFITAPYFAMRWANEFPSFSLSEYHVARYL